MHVNMRAFLSHLGRGLAGGRPTSSQALLTMVSRKAVLQSAWCVLPLEAPPAANRAPIHCCLCKEQSISPLRAPDSESRFMKSYFLKDRFLKIPFPSLVPNPHILVIGPESSVAKLFLEHASQDQ